MVSGVVIGILELGIYLPISYFLRKRFSKLQEINAVSYYWFMITILTFIWEFSYIAAYDEIENYAVTLLEKKEHVWTNRYDLTYILPWNLARIFYAEYGAYADREYMSLTTDWSKTVESSHAFFCGVFSLFALLLKANGNNRSFDITLGISMGSQLMNSLLYMVEYYYQVQDKNNVNYPTEEFPCGFAYYKRAFMWVNVFWIVMPTYTIIYSLMEKKITYKK
jgi:hypothetical protein